jgi:hypothetical protein
MQMGMRGKGKPLYAPQQLDSLFYWFKADEGVFDSLGNAVTTDDVGIAEWRDFSGNNYHVTQTTNGARPVYKATGGPGSKPTIQFDGTNDLLQSADHFWGSDDLTVIVVAKFANATRNVNEFFIIRTTGVDQRQFRLYGEQLIGGSYKITFISFQSGTVTPERKAQGGVKSTNFRVMAATHDGTSSGTINYIDGSAQSMSFVGTSNGTILDATGGLRIGDGPLQGSISEIIVYSRALSADERVGVEQYLKAKYSL